MMSLWAYTSGEASECILGAMNAVLCDTDASATQHVGRFPRWRLDLGFTTSWFSAPPEFP